MANNWAIVAGVNNYDFLPAAPLKFAVADALAMRSFLCDEVGFKSDQVLFCGDGTEGSKRATKPVLRDILLHQIQRAKNADNLWFFFSGHGIAEHLMTIDGNPRDLKETAISIHFVTDCLRRCKAKNIVLVLDMCRSESRDADERTVESIEGSLRELVKQREGQQGIITLFSCGRGESSYEVPTLGQGAFTYALLEGLRKTTIVKDLERHLAERVPELHRIHASEKRRKQVPLVIPEPGWKYDEPILSRHATEADVARLKEMAIDAECDGDFPMALRFWEQINLLATKPEDRRRALNKTTDLVQRSQLKEPASPTPTIELPQPLIQHPLDSIPLDSEKGIDYSYLCGLLKTGQWQSADHQTLRVMLKAANRESKGWLDSDSLRTFPRKDLKTIDKLWMTASNGHFGFSAQKKIWEECGRPNDSDKNWNCFCTKLGWKNERMKYSSCSNLRADLSTSPLGEFPARYTAGASFYRKEKGREIDYVVTTFFHIWGSSQDLVGGGREWFGDWGVRIYSLLSRSEL
ncbi:GUN4 domain-containing protein [Brasilonema bromeliae]|uniref:Caspase family p20 domain-containing protein n=1 Tax=Brasilonema bromeliae SPC951 TaxID=385972 RepID=A0ABX1PFV3_9CYAN|nr:GUN4 domain-containing protein [Brasilonema bromeliae]NMG22736.1 hypothetical protein [Brasilonema bromeliae SPC951]